MMNTKKLLVFSILAGVIIGLVAFSPTIYAIVEPHIIINMDPGQTTKPFVIKDNIGSEVFSVDVDGTISPGVSDAFKLDIVTQSSNDRLSILHNDEDTNISSRIDLVNDGGPAFVAAENLNSDIHIDIVTADTKSPSSVSVFVGDGDGSFSATNSVPIPGGVFPRDLEALDFDGNSNQDVAVLTRNSVELFEVDGVGNISFSQSIPIDTSSFFTPSSMTIGDVDNDGTVEIAVTKNDSFVAGNFTIISDTGGIVTSTEIRAVNGVGSGIPVFAVALANFVGDSNLDIVGISQETSGTQPTIVTYLGDGSGDFTFSSSLVILNEDTTVLRAGDFNNDGLSDIVYISSDARNALLVRLNNGDGTFGPSQEYTVKATTVDIKVGDLNLDGRLDIASVNDRLISTVQFLLGNGDGTFNPRILDFGVKEGSSHLVIVDLDTQ